MLKIKILFLLGINIMAQAKWKNWAQNRTCNAKIVTPKNEAELVDFIKKAKNENAKVHAYGSSHSWSDIVCVKDYLIDTKKLNKFISVDKNKNQVTVQAGMKLYDLNKKLEELGLNLSNQGAITKQSLAGVVSTATHGSGKTGTYASFITEVKLLTAQGKILTISEDQNSELFKVARTSIGALGIITQMTVQCEPLFKLKKENINSNWNSILQDYEKLLNKNDYMEFRWYASDDSVKVTVNNKVNINSKEKNTGYSYKKLSGILEEIYMEEEIAIPRTNFVQAAKAARNLVKENLKKNKMFDHILFRFVSAEKNNWLSPASDRDVVYFSIVTDARKGYNEFYQKFYDLMLKFDGRPHWGKINFLNQKDAKKLYGINFDNFVQIRKKLDPSGMFSNDFTKRVFGW